MDKLKTFARTPAARWLAVPILAGLGYGAVSTVTSKDSPASSTSWTSGPTTPSGRPATIEMTVASSYQTMGGKWLVNDSADYAAPDAKTVVIPPQIARTLGESPEVLAGKTIKVHGRETVYKGRKQLVATKVEVK
jgi:hypothetical protein